MERKKQRSKGSEATDSGEETQHPKTPEVGECVASTSRQSDGSTEQPSSSNEVSETEKEVLPTEAERPGLYARVRRSGTSAYQGHEYEWNLLGLTLLRAQKAKIKFCLTSEHEDIGALDDVVLQLLNDDGTHKSTMFLQAKHKEIKSKRGPIQLNDLLQDKKLALNKYFNSYRQIQFKFVNDKKTIFFFGAFEACRFVIFTNNALHSNIETATDIDDTFNELWPLIQSGDQKIVQLKLDEKSIQTLVDTYVLEPKLPYLPRLEHETELKNFLGKLYFLVGQPNHNELLRKIECEVETLLSHNVEGSKVCRAFMDLVKEWSGKDENKVKDKAKVRDKEKDKIKDEDKVKEKEKDKAKVKFLTPENPFLNEAILSVLTDSNVQEIKNYGIKFEEVVIKTLVNDIMDKASMFINIVASQGTIQLSASKFKLHQAMNVLQERHWKTFFLTVGQLNTRINSEKLPLFTRENTLIAFAAERTEDCQQVLTDLKRVLPQHQATTVVFITEEKVPGYNYIRDEFKFKDLTEELQKKLCDTEVTMQGQKIKLSQLIDTDGDKCKDIFTEELVIELIRGDDITIKKPKLLCESDEAYVGVYKSISEKNLVKALSGAGDNNSLFVIHKMGNQNLVDYLRHVCAEKIVVSSNEQDINNLFREKCQENPGKVVYLVKVTAERVQLREIYNPNFYHRRRFMCHEKVVFNPKSVLQKRDSDKFICYGTPSDEQKLVNACKNVNIIFKNSERDAKCSFRDVCNPLKNSSVHLLKIEGQNLIWERSQGSLKIIRDNIDQDLSTKLLVEESEFGKIVSDKLVIIADEPGMGKSTTLTSLSQRMMDKYWILRIDLRKCKKDIARLPENSKHGDFEIVTKFLCEVQDNDFNSKLLKNLLAHKLRHDTLRKPILLLFDGFDEISEDSLRRKIVELVQFLKHQTKANVCITTRKTHKKDLEDSFSMLAIEFEEFGEGLQQEFLSKFWHLSLILTCNHEDFEERLGKFPLTLTQITNRALGDNRACFMGIPLQLRMLAEGYQNDVTEFLNGFQLIPQAQMCLLGMYEKFILTKYQIYFEQKKKYPADAKNDMQILYKAYDKRHGILAVNEMLPNFHFRVDSIDDSVKNELKSVGIIQSIGMDGEIYFIHRTFAEYFIAKFLARSLKVENIKGGKFRRTIQFLDKQELHKNYSLIHKFLNMLLSNDSDVHSVVLENDLTTVLHTLNSYQEEKKDSFGRTALHLAAEMGNAHMVSVLINRGSDASEFDVLERSPLHYATIFGHRKIVSILLDDIADIDIRDNIFIEPLHYGIQVGDCIFKKPEQFHSNLFKFVNAKDFNGKPPLVYSCEKRHYGIAFFLISNGAEMSHIPQDSVKPLFDMAARNKYEIAALLLLKFPDVTVPLIRKNNHKSFLKFCVTGGHMLTIDNIFKCLGSSTSTLFDFRENFIRRSPELNANNYLKCFHYLLDKELLESDAETIYKVLEDAARKNRLPVYKHFHSLGSLSLSKLLLPAIKYDRLHFLEITKDKWHNVPLNDSGDYVLHLAASHGSLKIIKYLIRIGTAVDVVNKEGQTPLFLAAVNGKFDAVKYLAENSAEIHIPDKNGYTAFDRIAKSHPYYLSEDILKICRYFTAYSRVCNAGISGSVAQEIMAARLDVNKADDDGVYLLQKAAKYTSATFVRYLIDQGADVNVRDRSGKSALHYSTQNRAESTSDVKCAVNTLLENGSTYDARDNADNTILYYFSQPDMKSEYGKLLPEIREIFGNVYRMSRVKPYSCSYPLYKLKVDPLGMPDFIFKMKDGNLNTLLHLAATTGNEEVCGKVFGGMRKTLKRDMYRKKTFLTNKDGNTPLHIAVEKGFIGVTKMLLEEGFMTNTPNNFNKTPKELSKENAEITKLFDSIDALFESIKEGKLRGITDGIWRSSYKTVRNEEGQTLLHLAASLGRSEIVQWLCRNVRSLCSQKDNDGSSAIHLAAKFNSLSEVKMLSNDYDVNLKNRYGYTPLHFAAEGDHFHVTIYLLEKAIFSSLNNNGETPLDLAGPSTKVLLNTITELFRNDFSQICPAFEDFENLRKENNSTFLAALNARHSEGNTLLHFAAENDNFQLVKYLLQHGVPYDIKNSNSKGPKDFARDEDILALFQCIMKMFDTESPCVHLLSEIPGDFDVKSFLNICNAKGETVLVNPYHSLFKIKCLAKRFGADLNSQDQLGRTLLQHAADKRNLPFVKFLRN